MQTLHNVIVWTSINKAANFMTNIYDLIFNFMLGILDLIYYQNGANCNLKHRDSFGKEKLKK